MPGFTPSKHYSSPYAQMYASVTNAATTTSYITLGLSDQLFTTQTISYNMSYQIQAYATGSAIFTYPSTETPEQYAAQRIKYASANKRAEELLLAVLNDKQKKEYVELGYFETLVSDKVYRIKQGRSGNIRLVTDGKEIEKYCIHPVDLLPDPDTMLAQFLMLKSDEKAFLAKANKTILY